MTRASQCDHCDLLQTHGWYFDLDDYVFRALQAGASGFGDEDQALDVISWVTTNSAPTAPTPAHRQWLSSESPELVHLNYPSYPSPGVASVGLPAAQHSPGLAAAQHSSGWSDFGSSADD